MNTLVDPNDGASRVPEAEASTTSSGADADEAAAATVRDRVRAAVAPTLSASAPTLSVGDPTLVELTPPPCDDTLLPSTLTTLPSLPTLIELAPESGGTLVLPDAAAHDARRGWPDDAAAPGAATLVSPRPTDQTAAHARTLVSTPDRNHLKRWAPLAVGIASLCATAIPLSLRAPHPAAVGAADQRAARVEPGPGPAAPAEPPEPI